MSSFGLCRQRRGNGVGGSENRRAGEKCAGEAVAGADSGGVTPISTLMGEPERPADGKCRRRSGKTARCEPPKRWFILPKRLCAYTYKRKL